ncbi:MAG: hypothetical protein FRX48_08538 [Lasallia pustulata]|uniref:Uncharacterized protein n=1 Tax=Lasallia pustulata TaxID=136370 RepID=A0A1W5DBJ9_9LECA|nr:MAG: hypothetical protein FRX48_08538 [Lasallia pustulata]SLM40312.1 hypothetical protein LPUS_11059 [Lasallia pustulata]
MHIFLLLALLISLPILLFVAYLAISSCLGDRFRARISGFTLNPRHAVYDRSYLRTMTNSGPALSEQIEMHDIMNDNIDEDYA